MKTKIYKGIRVRGLRKSIDRLLYGCSVCQGDKRGAKMRISQSQLGCVWLHLLPPLRSSTVIRLHSFYLHLLIFLIFFFLVFLFSKLIPTAMLSL